MPALDRRRFLRTSAAVAGGLVAGPALWRRLDLGLFGPASATATASDSVAPPPIITRAEWGANEAARRGGIRFHPIRKFVIHHTASPNGDRDPHGRMRSLYAGHLNRRGETGENWIDLGYNYVVDEQGRIYEGRWARPYAPGEAHDGEDPYGRGVRGAHAEHANAGTVGIAVIGSYEGRRPTGATLDALASLIAWKCARHHLDPEGSEAYTRGDGRTVVLPTIVGHRHVKATACPGDGILALLPDLRRRVAALVPPPAPESATGGYRVVHANGAVTTRGAATWRGDLLDRGIRTEAVAMARRDDGSFWVADIDGGVHGFDAPYHGSIPGLRAAGQRIPRTDAVHIAASPGSSAYWVLDRAGGIFTFGGATFFGSVPGLRAAGQRIGRADAVAIEPTPAGDGYWVLDRAGGIFTFGHAAFFGSIPQRRNAGQQIGDVDAVDLRSTASGRGYWVLDRIGGVFTFGDAPYFGSVPGTGWMGAPARRLLPAPSGQGYALLLEDGAIIPFGDAPSYRPGPLLASVDFQFVP